MQFMLESLNSGLIVFNPGLQENEKKNVVSNASNVCCVTQILI